MPGIEINGNTYVLSQSWINTFMNCPEQARLEMTGQLPRKESDATAIGTAMHTAIEHVLTGASVNDGEQAGANTLAGLMSLPEFEFVQIKTEETLFQTYKRVFHCWANEIFPQLPAVKYVEYPFDVAISSRKNRTIRLRGAIDMVDEFGEIWDWKTANRPYDQWQVDRYKIQPTAYSMGLVMSTAPDQIEFETPDSVTFNYAVMMKSKQDCAVYTTVRTSQHWSWLIEQCVAIVDLIEADLKKWPLNDQHALCSPKWCTAWDNCKGLHFVDTHD